MNFLLETFLHGSPLRPSLHAILVVVFLAGVIKLCVGIPVLSEPEPSILGDGDDDGVLRSVINDYYDYGDIQTANLNHKIFAKSIAPNGASNNDHDHPSQASVSSTGDILNENHQQDHVRDIQDQATLLKNDGDSEDETLSVYKRSSSHQPSSSFHRYQQYQHQQQQKQSSIETEDKILQTMLSTKRDDMRFKIRNSSELHIDNHTNDENPNPRLSTNASNTTTATTAMKRVVVLQKPFHFHVPIITGTGSFQFQSSQLPSRSSSSSGKGKRGSHKRHHRSKHGTMINSSHSHNQDTEEGNRSSLEVQVNEQEQHQSNKNDDDEEKESKKLSARSVSFSGLNDEVEEEPLSSSMSSSNVDERGASAYGTRSDMVNEEGQTSIQIQQKENSEGKVLNLDQLLSQYPELIPSINRKRNSGKSSYKDLQEDESKMLYPLINIEMAPANVATLNSDEDNEKYYAERNVTNINFSQDVVNSILGHEDELVKYYLNIKSHAEKLGVNPEEIFHKIVFGEPESNDTEETSNSQHANSDIDISERRNEFRKLFENDAEEEEQEEIKEEESQSQANATNLNSPRSISTKSNTNEDVKILSRTKRGLKSWLKNIFKRGEPTTTTPRPRSKKGKAKKQKKVLKRGEPTTTTARPRYSQHLFDVDENGDRATDLLLPKALRRSTYLKNQEAIKKRREEEKMITWEIEQSGEKEVKTRYQEEPLRRKRSRREIHAASAEETEQSSILKLRNIRALSKDELILIEEMILNVVEGECVNFNRSVVIRALENYRGMTQAILKVSSLPDNLPEGAVETEEAQSLFSQLLACTGWLSNSYSYNDSLLDPIISDSSDNETMIESSRPLRRTKRIKRHEQLAVLVTGKVLSMNSSDDVDADPSLPEAVDDEMLRIALKDFMRFHFHFYKLVGARCAQYVEKGMLHDVTLILFNEISKLIRNLSLKAKAELYEILMDDSVLSDVSEKIFLECKESHQIADN